MLKILGKSPSINVRKVLWLCAELNLPFTHEEWGAGFQSTHTAEFLALNPNALVPVIIDAGFVLWESNTICRYLAAKMGREDLLPSHLLSRAKVEQWMDWQNTELNNAWRYAFLGLVRNSPMHQDPAAIAASTAAWNQAMQVLEGQLEQTKAYAASAEFTLADIGLGLATHRWFNTPILRPELPHVAAYYERLSQRPCFMLHGRNGQP